MLLHEHFDATARAAPDRLALVDGPRRTSYGELDRRAAAWAGWMQQQGVRRGDRVACCLDNSVEFAVVLLATLRCGAVLVPVGPATRPQRLAFLLADAGASLLFTQASLQAAATQALAALPGGHPPVRLCVGLDDTVAAMAPPATVPPTIDMDLAAIIYTSGSTGEPKGVMLSHLSMLSAAASVQAYLGLRADDVLLGALPLAFSYGLYQLLLAFRVGACVVLERSLAFPAQVLQTVATEQVTVLPGVPTLFAMLLQLKTLSSQPLPALRMLTSAGAALSPELIARLRAWQPQAALYSMYGLTECKRVSYLPPEQLDARPGSIGRGMPNQECWLVDEAGRRLPHGSTGELVVRGSHVMRGYWNQPAATAERLRPGPLPGEQVLHTGDLFRSDAEGWLYFVGRRDDIIKCRGEKVSPRAIEDALATHPAVLEAAVIGVPDPLLGQAIHAHVVLQEGQSCSERELIRHCAARLESHQLPQRVVFDTSLPHTDNGKVRKSALAAAAALNTPWSTT